MAIVLDKTTGSFSLTSSTDETTAITFAPTQNNIVKGIWLDFTNMTQTLTVRAKYQIDGTNLRTFYEDTWTTADPDGYLISGDIPVDDTLTVTLQSTIAEGASRDIPYQIWYEGMGAAATAWVYTLTNSVTSLPISGAQVWITTDSAGSQVVASGVTDSSGEVSFYLSANTYFVWRSHSDYSFSDNPDQEIVS